MKTAMLLATALGVLVAGRARAVEDGKQPPAELRNLEREVSLKLAHVRDEGSTDPGLRAQLQEAQRLDMNAEHEIASGAYESATENLMKANVILGRLGM
jgi:hypothetical protein